MSQSCKEYGKETRAPTCDDVSPVPKMYAESLIGSSRLILVRTTAEYSTVSQCCLLGDSAVNTEFKVVCLKPESSTLLTIPTRIQ